MPVMVIIPAAAAARLQTTTPTVLRHRPKRPRKVAKRIGSIRVPPIQWPAHATETAAGAMSSLPNNNPTRASPKACTQALVATDTAPMAAPDVGVKLVSASSLNEAGVAPEGQKVATTLERTSSFLLGLEDVEKSLRIYSRVCDISVKSTIHN